MEQSGKTINARQTAYMLFCVVTVYKLINLPQALLEGAGRDAWLGAVFQMAVEWLFVGLFLLLVKLSPNRTMEQLIERFCGKVCMRIIMGLVALYLCMRVLMMLTTTEQFLMTNLYDRISWIPLGLPILLILAYGAIKGLRSIARVNELVGVILVVCMCLCVAAIAAQADYRLLLPVLHDGAGPVVRVAETLLLGTGEAQILLFFVGRTEQKKLGRSVATVMAISTAIVVLFNLSFYAFYGEAGVHLMHGKAISDMLQYLRGSDSLARMDVFIVVAMLLLSLMKMLVLAWCAGHCVSVAFNLHKYRHGRLYAQLPVLASVFIAELLIQMRIFDFFSFLRGIGKYAIFVPYQLVLPVFILVLAIIMYILDKKKSRNEKGYRLKDGVITIQGVAHEPVSK